MKTGTAIRSQGRPKDPEKRAAVMQAAGRLFLEQGFERATMDAIAAEAGVSKLTVYSHFENKEALFSALVAHKCEACFGGVAFESLAELGPQAALVRVARGFMDLMLSPDVLALHRVLMASAMQGGEINRSFYASGPAPTLASFARLLAQFDAGGALAVPDPARAADHFFALLRGDLHLRALLNLEPAPPARRVREHIGGCVEVFLRAYGPAPRRRHG
ncbi:MAG: TetR/AcrR family transcriptional regulator [Gammaproteobacteria bacterium]